MKHDETDKKRREYENFRRLREKQLQIVEIEKRKSESCPYCGFMNMICKCPE